MQIHIPYPQTEEMQGNPQLVYACKLEASDLVHPRSAHSHPDLVEFIYILNGKGTYEIAGMQYPVEVGNLIVYNSNVMHNEAIGGQKLPILCCAATGIQLTGLPSNCLFLEPIKPVFNLGEQKRQFHSVMQMMYEEAVSSGPFSTRICHSLFLALLNMTLSCIQRIGKEQSAVTNFINHIGTNIRTYIDACEVSKLSVASILSVMNISESYLSRVFRQSFGCSVMSYIIRRRMGEAQTLLLTTNLSIMEISNKIGYPNQSYFTKIFTKSIGCSPLKYRKMYSRVGSDTNC
ncbi:MAG: AraC family transcriptional regulator [Lachnospiraceae bacterium]